MASMRRRPQSSNHFLGIHRYDFYVERHESTSAEMAEAIRVKRLREDAKRPISVNLAETIELSHALLKMADASKRR